MPLRIALDPSRPRPRRRLPSHTPSQTALTPHEDTSFPELTTFPNTRGVGAPYLRRACAVHDATSAADHHCLESRCFTELSQVAKVAVVHLVTGLREQGHGGAHHVLR